MNTFNNMLLLCQRSQFYTVTLLPHKHLYNGANLDLTQGSSEKNVQKRFSHNNGALRNGAS